METPIPESIVNRVRKLLALANDKRGNENEAMVAMTKANELLAEYNLSLAQIDETASPTKDAARERAATGFDAGKDWQVALMQAIARANFCMSFVDIVRDGKKEHRRHGLIGRTANVAVTQGMYDYLTGAMHRIMVADLPEFHTPGGKFGQSWMKGCVSRISSRLRTIREERDAADRMARGEYRGNGSDLVLADVYSSEEDLNNDFLYGFAPGTTAANRKAREAEWEARKSAYTPPAAPAKPETSAERRAREAAEEKWRKRWAREEKRQMNAIDPDAYRLGADRGRDIGLDAQIGNGAARVAIGG